MFGKKSTAIADAGYRLKNWGGACSGTGNCVVKMNASKTVSATFITNQYTLTVSKVGNGTVTSNPVGINCGTGSGCTAKFAANTNVVLTANPAAGYQFNGWSAPCANVTGPCTVNMTAGKTVAVAFQKDSSSTADFVITNINLIPATPIANATFIAAVTVKNQGTGTADGGYLDVWANQSSVMACGSDNSLWADVGTLKAGATKTLAFRLRAGTAGTKTLRAFVDSWCEITESKEDNNQLTKTYTVN